ncbi:DUF637 domain-containing protein [Acinetobacter pittii]|uniref:two-partner secretion domain-containing protein n=1 Tax=Acinetobacter pittii TaxID=48296 RepID=UPI001C21CAE5|nr:DUF637 domain-containing protein [Acinetobacter pittii]QWZ59256.1 DUF637 domain-containing protein [Acinetobacter pittii]
MNKNSYRIIYSKARQMFVAVAENVRSQTKTSGQSEASSQNNINSTESQAFHQLWQVKALVASISLWMPLAPVYAGIVADSAANAANRAVIAAGKNSAGTVVPVVNIQTPKNGISHNIYKQFDVLAEGAVLNNSRQGATTKTVGNVAANPFLATGEARVILNEVNSSAASRFEGNLEVAGQMADVIIANPSGISIKGGGFINANKAIFTTGKPQLNADGSIKQFTVDQGKITVSANPNSKFGLGGNNNDANYVDLYARALELSAELRAKNDIQVIAGANNVSADLQDVTAKTGTGTAPTLAVDVKALGGMYANNIYLMGTEKGLGVTNAGTIQAVNNLVITSAGKIEHSGTISSTSKTQGLVNIQTTGTGAAADINSSGSINSNSMLNIDSGNNLNVNAKEMKIMGDSVPFSAFFVNTKGDLNFAPNTRIMNLGTGDLYVNSNNILMENNAKLYSLKGDTNINIGKNLQFNSLNTIGGGRDLNIISQGSIVGTQSSLRADTGTITLHTNSNQGLIDINSVTIDSRKKFEVYSLGDVNLKNIGFKVENSETKLKDINIYSGNNVKWDNSNTLPQKISGKIQIKAEKQLDLISNHFDNESNSIFSSKDDITLEAKKINVNTSLLSEKNINITSKEDDLILEKNLNAQSDINLTSLAGGVTANSLKATSSAGKISILANKNINLNSTQTSKAMSAADKDELTTDQTVISGLKGVTLGSIGDGIVNLQSVQVNANQGDILVSSNNGINLKANTDVVVTGDTGRFKTVNNVLKGQTVSIENSKSDIKIQNTDLSSTVGKLAINSRAGMSTIIDSVLTSKGNTELYAKDLLTLQGVNATSDQHLAVSSGRTVYSNAEYTPATKWIADKVTNLTSKGVTSVTATGNQVLQNTNLTGGAVLLEAGGFILGQTGLNLNAVGSDLLKNDTKLNSLNGDLTIQTNSNLTIDPKVYSLKAVGDIELVSKTGTLTLKGYEGAKGNGSEQVVKLDTANGGINLEGTKVDIQGSQLIAKKDIQVVSTKDDLLIDGVRNSFSNIKFPDKANREKIVKTDFIQELNVLKATQEYLNYQQALKDANDQIKAGEDWMRTAQGSIALTAKRLKDEGERKLAQVNETYKTLITSLNGLQRNIDQSGANISFYEQNLKGQQHASVNIKSIDGNINLVSAKGLSLSGSKVNAQQGEVRIEAAGTLTNNIYNIQGQYDSATENSVKQGAIASSIIIDANQDSYEFGNETDTTYAWRSPVDAPSIYGKKGVKIKATGTNTTDNLVLQGVDIRSEGDVNIEAHKNIIFDVAVESGYDKSTTTETKKKWYGKKTTTTTVNTSNKSEGVSVNINAKNINIKSKEQNTKEMTGKNRTSIDMYSSQFTATGGKISIQAGGDLNFLTALDVEQNTDDITKKSSFLGVKLNKSKTTATRNIKAELPATLKADYIGTKSGLDTRLKGPEFEYLSGATIEAGGVISLESASNVVEQTLKRDKNSVVWQSMQDKGSITETAQLPSFNGPVLPTFKAAGGLSVQVPISEKDANKVELRDAILDLSKKPGNEYLKELVNRKDVDWQKVLLTQKDWDYKQEGLTGAGAAIIVIIVTILTSGVGTGPAAAAGGGISWGSMGTAALTSLKTQAVISLVNNKGDIGKTLKDLGSKDTVKNMAVAAVTQFAMDGINTTWSNTLSSTGITPNKFTNFINDTAQVVGKSLVETGIQGGSFSEVLEGNFLNLLSKTLQANLSTQIKVFESNTLDANYVIHKVLHGLAGCASASIQNKDCGSAAFGSAFGEIIAEQLEAPDPNLTLDEFQKQQAKLRELSKLVVAGVAAYTGLDTNIATQSAEIAIANNRQLHNTEKVILRNEAKKLMQQNTSGTEEYWYQILQMVAFAEVDARGRNFKNETIKGWVLASENNQYFGSGTLEKQLKDLETAQKVVKQYQNSNLILKNGKTEVIDFSTNKPLKVFLSTNEQFNDPTKITGSDYYINPDLIKNNRIKITVPDELKAFAQSTTNYIQNHGTGKIVPDYTEQNFIGAGVGSVASKFLSVFGVQASKAALQRLGVQDLKGTALTELNEIRSFLAKNKIEAQQQGIIPFLKSSAQAEDLSIATAKVTNSGGVKHYLAVNSDKWHGNAPDQVTINNVTYQVIRKDNPDILPNMPNGDQFNGNHAEKKLMAYLMEHNSKQPTSIVLNIQNTSASSLGACQGCGSTINMFIEKNANFSMLVNHGSTRRNP